MRTFFAVLLVAATALAQGNTGGSTTGVSRGNGLRIPQYRTPGTGTQSYFVDAATGDDSFDCRSASTPCLTLQGAINKAPKLTRDQVTVTAAAGNYAGFLLSGFTADVGIQQTTGGIVIEGTLANSTLATGTATGTATGGTAGSGSTWGTLVDAAQTWTVNDLVGRFITTASPTNTTYVITANTGTTITVVGNWSVPVAATTTYTIQDPSTIITSARSSPASPNSASGANRAAIQVMDNNLTYRRDAIVLRNFRLTNASGFGVEVSDNSGIFMTAMQVRNTTGSVLMGSLSQGTAQGRLDIFHSDLLVSSTSQSAIAASGGSVGVTNSLLRGPGSGSGIAISLQAVVGVRTVLTGITSGDIRGFANGIIMAGAGSNFGGSITSSSIACNSSSGYALKIGDDTAGAIATAGATASMGGVQTTALSTCGNGIYVYGPRAIDIISLSGSVATNGFFVNNGGRVTFTKAGVTLTSGTNEINFDNGAVLATFADVAAGSCIGTEPHVSRVCGR